MKKIFKKLLNVCIKTGEQSRISNKADRDAIKPKYSENIYNLNTGIITCIEIIH